MPYDDSGPELVDLLGAMADYFELRNDLSKSRAESDDYSFDYFHASEIDGVDRAYKRVQAEWAKLFPIAAMREP